jgi:hypothetical protein
MRTAPDSEGREFLQQAAGKVAEGVFGEMMGAAVAEGIKDMFAPGMELFAIPVTDVVDLTAEDAIDRRGRATGWFLRITTENEAGERQGYSLSPVDQAPRETDARLGNAIVTLWLCRFWFENAYFTRMVLRLTAGDEEGRSLADAVFRAAIAALRHLSPGGDEWNAAVDQLNAYFERRKMPLPYGWHMLQALRHLQHFRPVGVMSDEWPAWEEAWKNMPLLCFNCISRGRSLPEEMIPMDARACPTCGAPLP